MSGTKLPPAALPRHRVDAYAIFRAPELIGVSYQDRPEFRPDISPRQMLEMGVYEGYFARGEVLNIEDLPMEWFENSRWADRPLTNLNHFGVRGLAFGWGVSTYEDNPDPLGWLQWYCRFDQGRRVPDWDNLNIALWQRTKGRHTGAATFAGAPNAGLYARQCLLEIGVDPWPDYREWLARKAAESEQ